MNCRFGTSALLLAFAISTGAAENPPSKVSEKRILGLWEGVLKVGPTELRLGFEIAAKPAGALTATMNSVDQGAKDIPVGTITFADRKLVLELLGVKASYEGLLADDGNSIKGDWQQSGLTLPLELKRVDRLAEVRRPQTPKKPYPYDEEVVVVQNKAANVRLAGTLTKPKGAGPFRAAVMITGSGPQDRDETLFNHKPFLVLADHLTRNGVAVLRCDDRGVGKSTGEHSGATTADFAADTHAMIAFLRKRKDIKQIGLIGHSEGSLIASMVAATDPDVAFIVLLAGPGMPGDELLMLQSEAHLKAAKADEQTLQWQRGLQKKLLKLIKDGATPMEFKAACANGLKDMPEDVRKQAGDQIEAQLLQSEKMLASPWFRYFLALDPRIDLKKVRCPVLALNGAKDLQVPAAENLTAIEKALKAGGNDNVTVREFPGLNHLFQACKTGLPDEYGSIEETMAPIVWETIGEWVKNLKNR
jgi:pimeloyl-ACP methyl ester carboxylesterase